MKKLRLITFLFLSLLCISLNLTSIANASDHPNSEANNEYNVCIFDDEASLQNLIDQNVKNHDKLVEYLYLENNIYFFNSNKAQTDGFSELDVLTGEELAKLKNIEATQGSKQNFDNTNNKMNEWTLNYSFGRYGNYCGLGNSGGKPVNTVDKICQTHDNCYSSKGWGKCSCDKALIISMTASAVNPKLSKTQRAFAGAAAMHFAFRVKLGLYKK